jgi:hypothetical protein
MGVRFVSPCDGCPPLPFIDGRGRGKTGNKRKVTVFGRWDVLSCVVVRLGALKRSRAMLSWRPPRGRAGLFTLGRIALLLSSLGLTQPIWARDVLATLRPNCRPVLIVGGTRVPQVEFACCRVGWDDDMMAAQPGRAALRLLSEPGARACRQLVRLHGMSNRRPTHHSGRVHVSGSCHVVRLVSWSEMESAHANKLLVVRGGDWSKGLPLVGNWSEKLPTSRQQHILPVMVLTGVFSPRLESWPSHCQWCQKTPPQKQLSRRQRGPNMGPRQYINTLSIIFQPSKAIWDG